MTDRTTSVFAMVRDPRLRRLFALVGRALADQDLNPDVEDAFYAAMLDLAPEYLPPDELGSPDDDTPLVDDWQRMIRRELAQDVR